MVKALPLDDLDIIRANVCSDGLRCPEVHGRSLYCQDLSGGDGIRIRGRKGICQDLDAGI